MMSTRQFSVLIVDDEPRLRGALRTSLISTGFAVREAHTADEALEVIEGQIIDLAVLGVDMPGASGLELCRQLRALGHPIGIVLVACGAEKDMVEALEAGADDCVAKPFRLGELTARCHAVLRRVHVRSADAEPRISAGDLELDLDRRLLRKAGRVVHLTPTEFNLLAFLMKNQGVAITHSKLLRTIWGPEYGGELEYLRSYVRLLRKKIENNPAQPKYLVTEAWLGYRFCGPSDTDCSPSDVGTF
jgi:two-component system, OmpR family, KDP operon response regulator KdpE